MEQDSWGSSCPKTDPTSDGTEHRSASQSGHLIQRELRKQIRFLLEVGLAETAAIAPAFFDRAIKCPNGGRGSSRGRLLVHAERGRGRERSRLVVNDFFSSGSEGGSAFCLMEIDPSVFVPRSGPVTVGRPREVGNGTLQVSRRGLNRKVRLSIRPASCSCAALSSDHGSAPQLTMTFIPYRLSST